MDPDKLLEQARGAQERAYAPHSAFRVGAALLGRGGVVHLGCNVENASYGLTICAERAAVAAAVAAGETEYEAIAIVTDADDPVAPCGACRQVLAEFAPDVRVISEGGGRVSEWTLSELLPAAFRGVSKK